MDGQLGTGDRKSQIVPTRELCLIDRKIEHVACGSDFTVVIDMDGKVWAWGRNENGEVGHPPRAESQPFIRLPPGAQNVMVKTNRRVISIPSRAINLRLGVLKPQHVPDVPEIPPLHRQEGERGLIHLELPRLPHDLDDEHWASILRQTLQRLWGLYDRDRVQGRCVEQDLWDSASDVAALRGDLPLALQYRLTALEQMPPERAELTTVACLVVQHYIRNCVEADGVDEMGLPAPPDWLQLLEAALKFWLTHKLPLSDLETTLRSQLDTLAPSLAIYIIRGIDMPDGPHVRLDRQLSDTFCLDVVAAVAQQIQQGQLSTPLVKQIVGDGDDDDSAKSPPAAKQDGGGRVTSAAPPVTADRLWTEVMTSLRIQPGGAAQHVALSAADVERLRQETDGSDADDRQVALFSCGHNFARHVFADAVLGKLERSLQGNAHVPAQTAQLIVSMYKAPGFVPLACPDCVLRELEQGSLETRM
ncbi:PREDICTED: uncharacterized protein LOC106807903 [Priapulus caudatus]|uniref:Uncharacterized protein LOC106807903 n=1 Tax=Priapulus caudatus TaxID=37621 RepID=A0ABM1E127_PRICU|nr:PREDICTED: uncharacterized protein LOC106807903 [Priapulus caudatus]